MALALALSAFLLWHFSPGVAVPQEESSPGAETAKAGPRRRRIPPSPRVQGTKAEGESVRGGLGEQGGLASKAESMTEVGPAETEEALVNAFYVLTDKWLKPSGTEVPMAEVEKFREQFYKIPRARKKECLQRAFNLLPDENVMLLAGILLDKGQPADCIELVFDDILSREEAVKKPILKEIYKDREHPCWATTAWILDVTGNMPGK